MAKMIIRGQMVRISEVKETVVEGREDKMKTLFFTVADRDKMPRKNKKNETVYVTKGFYFCKAYGKDAENIAKHFSEKDANDKLISRKIFLEVDAQSFKNHKEVEVSLPVPAEKLFSACGAEVPENVKGKLINLKKKEMVEYDDTCYVVRDWDFDDYKKAEETVIEVLDEAGSEINIEIE